MNKRYIFRFKAIAPDKTKSDYSEFCGIPKTLNELIQILSYWINDGYTIQHLTIKGC